MIGTITVHGSDGEVMAPFGGSGTFYRGKRRDVLITAVSQDGDVPLSVREALVGMKVSTIFTTQQLDEQVREGFSEKCGLSLGSCLAYAEEVIELLEKASKIEEATALRGVVSNKLDMYTIEPEVFEVVSN